MTYEDGLEEVADLFDELVRVHGSKDAIKMLQEVAQKAQIISEEDK